MNSLPRRALVTGSAGFLGRHLTAHLLEEGWEVVAFCREGDRVDLLPAAARVHMGNLLDAHSLDLALADAPDAVVFHLAGNTTTWSRYRDAQFRDNVEGTRGVIAAAERAGARRLVYTSSISAYGWQPGVRLDERSRSNVQEKGDNYGKSKYAAEQLVKMASAAGRISGVILNPVNIIGAGDAANWSKQLILPIARNSLWVVPPGNATWISVHDVVDAHLAAVDAPLDGENVILGGVEATFLEVVRTIAALLGKPEPDRATPRPVLGLAFAATQLTAALTRREPELSLAKYRRATGDLIVDDRLARQVLALGRTPLAVMLGETIQWLRDVHLLDQSSTEGVA
ncbi:MAG: NAD-dependent epimerase/dehydratase family protein [Microbacteriaceae bacterium]